MFQKKLLCTMVVIVSLFVCACGGSETTEDRREPDKSYEDSVGGGSGDDFWNDSSDKTPSATPIPDRELGYPQNGDNLSEGGTDSSYVLSEGDGSEYVIYDETALTAFAEKLKNTATEYGYEKLFDAEKSLEGVSIINSVESHPYSALDDNGKLTKEHLYEVVKKNTAEYLNTKPMMIKAVDDSLIKEVCDIMVDVVNGVLSAFPDIDKERVYCNLAQVKVVQKTSSMANAFVDQKMRMHVNKQMSDKAAENGFYKVIVHETMHIIQFACPCENGEEDRRFGISHYYEDWETQYADWTWLGEGSAERMANLYIDTDPMTYMEHIKVIRTMDVLAALRKELPANYVETICFYEDADNLFSMFDSCTKEEVCRMMYALELAIEGEETLKSAYPDLYGGAWTSDEKLKVTSALKSMAMKTLSKQFFCDLSEVILMNNLTRNDVLFLLDVYESSLNQILLLGMNQYKEYNAEFVSWYKTWRDEFFALFENVTEGDYLTYQSGNTATGINASLSWLPESKINVIMKKQEEILQNYRIK